jgi:hypothetical protein
MLEVEVVCIHSETLQEKRQNKHILTKYIERYPKMDFMLIGSKGNQRTLCVSYYELLLIRGLNSSKFLRNF